MGHHSGARVGPTPSALTAAKAAADASPEADTGRCAPPGADPPHATATPLHHRNGTTPSTTSADSAWRCRRGSDIRQDNVPSRDRQGPVAKASSPRIRRASGKIRRSPRTWLRPRTSAPGTRRNQPAGCPSLHPSRKPTATSSRNSARGARCSQPPAASTQLLQAEKHVGADQRLHQSIPPQRQ